MKGFGKANPWAAEIMSSPLMKKPVSRLGNENIILWDPSHSKLCASNMNMKEKARGLI